MRCTACRHGGAICDPVYNKRAYVTRASNRYPVLTGISSLRLGTVLREVPGAWIVRTAPHTPKFKRGSEGRGGDCADTFLLPQLADHARNAYVLSAGLEIKCDIVNGRTTRNPRAHPLGRWCHVAVIPCRSCCVCPFSPGRLSPTTSTVRFGARPSPSALVPRRCSHSVLRSERPRRPHEMPGLILDTIATDPVATQVVDPQGCARSEGRCGFIGQLREVAQRGVWHAGRRVERTTEPGRDRSVGCRTARLPYCRRSLRQVRSPIIPAHFRARPRACWSLKTRSVQPWRNQ